MAATAVVLTSFVHAQTPATASHVPVSLYGAVPHDPGVNGMSSTELATPDATDSSEDVKRGEFVVAPIPIVNPTLEDGLAVVGGYLYRLDANDQTTPPSVTGAGGFKTNNGSWAAAALQTLHLAHDLIRVRVIAAYADVSYAFFGIGQGAGNAGASIELNQVGPVGVVEALVRVLPRSYFGARYQLLDMTVKTGAVSVPGGPTLPAADARLRSAALGPRFEYDSRDNTFYPRHGLQLQGIASFYGEAIGGERNYQVYEAWLNQYQAIGTRNVAAWHVSACGAEGPVAFYDLCLLGKPQDLRGYTIGRYRDHAMVAAQTEWRTELWWRFGAVAFAGGAVVAPDFGTLAWKDVLPGGGGGLRFTLAKHNHVNLRVDYAWGRSSSALYVGVAEAF